LVRDALKQLDSVAYVRCASIYRDFKDLPDFVKALEGMMAGQGQPPTQPAPAVLRTPADLQPTPSQAASGPTPLFPGLAPAHLGPAKRRKGR